MFENLQSLPQDPLLGLILRFNNDTRKNKIDLGVGVYKDAFSHTPVLHSIKLAEQFLLEQEKSKAYVGASGNIAYSTLMAKLLLGESGYSSLENHLAALQTPGGCGALRVLAELIKRDKSDRTVWVSDPTWANHMPLLGDAGLSLKSYPYYDYRSHQVRFDEMIGTLEHAQRGDIVLLHASCHNPSGADLSPQQWQALVELLGKKQLVPFLDVAYQGFGESIDKDAYGLRLAAQKLDEILIAVSCSKNFGLYRERVGCAFVISKNKHMASAAKTHLLSIARGIYSMPPSHGASIVEHILSSDELRAVWQKELVEMRDRIFDIRKQLTSRMSERLTSNPPGKSIVDSAELPAHRFDFIEEQSGMFSFLGIDEAQVERLATEYGIYMASNSRINMAGLNDNNLDYFCQSLSDVL